MLGTIVNTAAIVCGCLIGATLKKGISEKYREVLYTICGLAACGIGINAIVTRMPESNYPVLFIVALALGGLLGTRLDLDQKFNQLVNRNAKSNLGQGLSTGILLFCIGALSIMGPVMSAINGDHTFLFTNATLDFITSMVLASTYGYGMLLSAPVLFAWQGAIYLVARYANAAFFSDDMVRELCIVGGFLIASTGLSILKIKDMKTLNLLPSLLVPVLFFLVKGFF